MDCSMPGFPVLQHLSKLAQTHVHGVSDAIQPSYPLSSPSPPALNLSQHPVNQLFASGGQSIGFSISPFKEYSKLFLEFLFFGTKETF